jgi:MFS transporter, DHA2 family, multidrug resistance protein
MFAIALYLCIFCFGFNFTSSLMGGTYMVGALGGSFDISPYNTTFFGLGNACSLPISYALAERFGKLFILKLFTVFFLVMLLIMPSSPTFFILVMNHFFFGFSAGVFYPLGFELIQKTLSEEKKAVHLAFTALLMTISPVLGACFGGWIAYSLQWKWIFYLQVLPAILVFTIFCTQSDPSEEKTLTSPFDSVGYISYAISICLWTVWFCLGQELDWFRSYFLSAAFALATITTVFFILWEWNHKEPFFDIRLVKISSFSLGVFSVIALFSAYFGMIILLTLWLHLDVNYTYAWISVLLLHMIIAGIVLFVFIMKWIKKLHPLTPILLATAMFAISCFYSTSFNAEIDFGRIAISRILAGFGLAFFLFPLLLFTMNSLPLEKKTEGMKIFQSCRLLAGSLGISFYTTLWYRRKVFYQERLGSSLTDYSENTRSALQSLSPFTQNHDQSKELLEKALHTQSTVLAFADCFYFMGWLMILLLGLLLAYYAKMRLAQKKLSKKQL